MEHETQVVCDYCGGWRFKAMHVVGAVPTPEIHGLHIDWDIPGFEKYQRSICYRCIDKIFTTILGEPKKC